MIGYTEDMTTETAKDIDPDDDHEFVRLFEQMAEHERAAMDRWTAAIDAAKSGAQIDPADLPSHIGKTTEQIRDMESERADELIQAAINEFGGQHAMSDETLIRLTMYTGRIYGPRALFVLDYLGALAPDAYPVAVPYVWGLAEFPGNAMSTKDWRALWLKAGFTVDHEPAERPTEPVTVWRACWPQHKRHMSWTDDVERAKHFLKIRYGNMRLYTATVPPERLLARIHEGGRGENEWIVDTRTVQIKEVKTP